MTTDTSRVVRLLSEQAFSESDCSKWVNAFLLIRSE